MNLNAHLVEGFAGLYLSSMYDNKAPTPPFHREVWELYCSEALAVAVAAPRGHAKSTGFTHSFGSAAALFRLEPHILIVSATEELAMGHLGDISAALHDNDDLRAEFGIKTFHVDAKAEIVVECEDGYQFRFIARGAGQKLRGMKWRGRRPGLVLCHKKGTRIFADGAWMAVEDHPTAREQTCAGCIVEVNGLPFSETVTKEHRYWVRRIVQRKRQRTENGVRIRWTDYEKETGWREAQYLSSRDYVEGSYYGDWLGTPIDQTVASGQFDSELEADPDFWWALGLWWGDGSASSANNVVWHVADGDAAVSSRLERFLRAHNFHYSGYQREGCFSLTITNERLATWLKSWCIGNSQKIAPDWLMCVHPILQAELLKGYMAADGFVDKRQNEARLTSVCYEGLLQVRAMLARLGIPASIRKGLPARQEWIQGRLCNAQQKYDLRFQKGASQLGLPITDPERYALSQVFIEDGFLWCQVSSVRTSSEEIFVPITTKSHTYTTDFGLSHNCDDIEEDEQVENPDRRKKFRKWVMRALLPLMRKGGKIRWHGTIMHEDAMLARLMKDSEWESRLYKAHTSFDDFTDILWPEMFDEAALRKVRQKYINQGDGPGYSQEYLNDPLDLEDKYLQEGWFIPMTDGDRRKSKLICAAADFGITKNQASNRTSLTIGGMCVDNLLHFIDQRVSKWDSLEIVEQLFKVHDDWHPDVFWVESGQIWAALKPMLTNQMLQRGIFINFVERAPIKDKPARGRSLQRRMRAGGTRWDTESSWFEPQKEEMLRFTEHSDATLDDQFDSSALLSLGFDEMAVVDEEDFVEEDELEMRRTDPRVTDGRSQVTGY